MGRAKSEQMLGQDTRPDSTGAQRRLAALNRELSDRRKSDEKLRGRPLGGIETNWREMSEDRQREKGKPGDRGYPVISPILKRHVRDTVPDKPEIFMAKENAARRKKGG